MDAYDRHDAMRKEQPINWSRAFIGGFIGVSLMMAFVDIFAMMGWTAFTFEAYLGSLFYPGTYGPRGWIVGLIANWVVGSLIGILYGYFFEYVFSRANAGIGALTGLIHAVVAGLTLFPFFTITHEWLGTDRFETFGFLGSALGPATFVILLLAHVLYGMVMGLIYGPVRQQRLQMQYHEPGEYGQPGERGVITDEEDPQDRMTG